MAPMNSQLVSMSPDRTSTRTFRDGVFIINLFAFAKTNLNRRANADLRLLHVLRYLLEIKFQEAKNNE
jgi:hypothetical protein